MMRSLALASIGCVLIASLDVDAQRPAHERLFSPELLGILESPDRDDWQQPERIMDALQIGDRSRVADLGAGGGWFTVRLARRVGPNGRVYAHDIQTEMIESIRGRMKNEGLKNIEPRLGTASDPGLVGPLDAVLIVDTYPQLSERAADRVGILQRVRAALATTGRLGVVDFRLDGAGGPGPPLDERMDPEQIKREAREAGLEFLREEALPYQYLLIFGPGKKAALALPARQAG
jgi:predicted methyltransferase